MYPVKIINLTPWLLQEIKIDNRNYCYWSAKPNPPLDLKSCQESVLPFAWVLWDPETGVIEAARDPFGQIPLFYFYSNNQFIFSNNIKKILDYLPKMPDFNLRENLTDRVFLECFQIKLGASVPDVSTETYFKNIYRVSPGSRLKIKNNNLSEEKYWVLNPEGPDLILSSDQDYKERFEYLLKQSLKDLVGNNSDHLAQELSGGLDSSSIFLAAHELGLKPHLFTHSGADSSEQCEHRSVLFLKNKFGLEKQHEFIDAEDFNPIENLKEAAKLYPGAPPYIFFMLANNIHEAVKQKSCTKLLSGFLGDECISSHAGLACFIPDLLKRKQYRNLWADGLTRAKNSRNPKIFMLKELVNILRYSHPEIYKIFNQLSELKRNIKNIKKIKNKDFPIVPMGYLKSIRQRDYENLQGCLSHTVNMRVEYSAIAAEALGFEYVYPFLYRPLVEFCFYLPPELKRREGKGRYLIREFFAERTKGFTPDKLKMTGSIMPGTFDKCQQSIKSGEFDKVLNSLKHNFYKKYVKGPQHFHIETILKINALMWGFYLES